MSNKKQQYKWNKKTYIGETHVYFHLHKFEWYNWQCNNNNRINGKKRNDRYQYKTFKKPNITSRAKLKSYINMQGK